MIVIGCAWTRDDGLGVEAVNGDFFPRQSGLVQEPSLLACPRCCLLLLRALVACQRNPCPHAHDFSSFSSIFLFRVSLCQFFALLFDLRHDCRNMATTAASPRKDARAFEQTWDESDTAFLDPTSLPIQRLPRAWDRKQEVKKIGNGRTKEIWRKYGTRSRTSNAASNGDPEDDIRARPVKRLQRMSPKAIEKSAASQFGKARAFKATRWDRRKSVLPSK